MSDSFFPTSMAPPPGQPNDAVAAGPPISTAIASGLPQTAHVPSIALNPRLRLWPAALIVVAQWSGMYIGMQYFQGTMVQMLAMFALPRWTLLFVCWWLFASRAPWPDRFKMLGVAAFSALALYIFSEKLFGGFGLIMYALPTATTAWTLWLLATYALPWRVRFVGLFFVVMLSTEFFALLRLDGVYGKFAPIFSWRWGVNDETRHQADLASGKIGVLKVSDAQIRLQPGDWPCFRGPNRDGRLTGVRIATDWDKNPPKLLWKHTVGPGWSSFAVIGKRLYTQEQHEAFESVICYDSDTGGILWKHEDEGRFTNDQAVAGIGPRATPTFHDGKIYSLGATGQLNCLDADSGIKQWTCDIKKDGKAKEPQWGYSSSPLIVHGNVIVFAGGPDDHAVLAYNADTGKLAWATGKGKQLSYCSPQLVTVEGVEQIVLTSDQGLLGIDPKDGKELWTFDWPTEAVRVTQPALVGNSDFLLGTGFGRGTQRVHVKLDKVWTATKVWSTRTISPYYNDLVVHKGHAFGFDNGFFACVDLEDGKNKWRKHGNESGENYGNGQVLLLVDQDLLLILCENGDVALVEANPAEYKEVSRFKAIEGLTWNHPVIAHGRLFVRNKKEAACFGLTQIK